MSVTLYLNPGESIQAAIDSLSAGDTLVLRNGTHTIASTIYVNKDITFSGESEAGVTLDASGLNNGSGYAMVVNADGATLSYFTLVGGGGGAGETARGIKAQPDTGVATDRLDGLTIEHVTVQNFRVAEIDLNAADNALLKDVTADGMGTNGAGIALTDVRNITLENIDVSNNLWGGVAIYSGGDYYAAGSNGSHNVQFTGTFTGPASATQAQPILIQASNGYPIDSYTLPNSFDYAVYNGQYRADGSEFLTFFASPEDATAFALAIQSAPAIPNSASVIYQNAAADGEAFVEGNIMVFPGMSLAAANAAAKDGQVVHLIGTSGDDFHAGRNGQPDWFTGGEGNDVFNGGSGAGNDRFIFDSVNASDVTIAKFGNSLLFTSSEGLDTVSGIEALQFADGEVYDVVGTNIIANTQADTDTAVEDDLVASEGNVLDNDADHNIDGGPLVVSAVSGGTVGAATAGAYGTLTLDANGDYSYLANNADSIAQGETQDDVFTYTVSDGGVLRQQTLTITVSGVNDAPVIGGDTAGTVWEPGSLDNVRMANFAPEYNFAANAALSAATEALVLALAGDGAAAIPVAANHANFNAAFAAVEAELGTADAIALIWDRLDAQYSYYNTEINAGFIELGVAYVAYLQNGGKPLTDVVAKFTVDGVDVDTLPDRNQSMHDNILGNFYGPAYAGRFSGALKTELDALLHDNGLEDLLNRPYVAGDVNHPVDVAGALAFDVASGLLPASSGVLTALDPDDGATATWSGDDNDSPYGTFDIDESTGAWTFTLKPKGADHLAEGDSVHIDYLVTVTDDTGATDTQVVTITVKGSNDAPIVDHAIAALATDEDAAFSFDIPADAFADVDDGPALTYTATLEDGSPLPDWLSFDGTTFSGTPENRDVGAIMVAVTATDEFGAVATQSFELTVNNTNDDPTFGFFQDFSANADGVTADFGYGELTLGGGQAVVKGVDGTGPYTFFDGRRDTFVDGLTAEVKVFLDTSWTTGEGFDYSVAAARQTNVHLRDFIFHVIKTDDGLFVGADNNGNTGVNLNQNPNGKTAVADSGWYTLQHVFSKTDGPNPTLVVTMNLLNDLGDVVFTEVRTTSDAIDTTVGGQFYGWFNRIEVTDGIAIDDLGLIDVDSGAADEGTGGSINLSGFVLFNDIDGDAIGNADLSVVAQAGQPALGNFNAEVTEDPAGNSGGTISWTFDVDNDAIDYLAEGDTLVLNYDLTIVDNHGGSATKTITVTVVGTNDAPIATAEEFNVAEDGAAATGFLNVTDADAGHVLTYSADAVDGFTLNETTGEYSFDPSNPSYLGLSFGETLEVVVNYTATDDQTASVDSTITFVITGTNDAPVVSAVTNVNVDEGAGTVTLNALANATDSDGDNLIVTPDGALPAGVTFIGDSLSIDFEDYSLGSVIGQNGWFDASPSAPSQAIVDVGGNKMLVVANDPTLSDFGGPYSPGVSVTAGELGSGADVNQIEYSFNFKPVAGSPDGSRLELDVGNEAGTDRNNFMVLEYFGGTLSIKQQSPGTTVNDWVETTLATDIDPTVFHTVRAVLRFGEGQNNDVIDYYLDDVLVGSGSTFENYRDWSDPTHSNVDDVNRLFFRTGNFDTGFLADGPGGNRQGFYIDDIKIATSNSAGPHFAFDANDPAYDHLKAGATEVVTVNYTVDDGITSTPASATFTVTGTNDAPVAQDDAFSVNEDDVGGIVSGSVTATDVDDGDEANLIFSTNDVVAGLTLNDDGSYSFDPSDAAYQALAEGEELEIVVNYKVEDVEGDEDFGKLTITVIGANDAPVVVAIDSDLTGEVTEPVTAVPVTATGTIVATDDSGISLAYSTTTPTSDYGTFAVDPSTGEWTFTLGEGASVQALNDGDSIDVTFSVTVSDGDLQTNQDVVITINGSNELFNGTPGDEVGPNALLGTGYSDTIYAGAGDDTVYGAGGNDIIYGDDGDDSLFGGSGNDFIYGGENDDYIEGGSGNDTLAGNRGHDVLLGGSGDDVLWGGGGVDTMTGGSGSDTFKFVDAIDSVRGGATDLITDFEAGVDKIDLSMFDANTELAGIQQFVFRGFGDNARKEDAGYIKYFQENGNTFIVGGTDNNPDGFGELLIKLTGNLTLTADDFIGLSDVNPDVGTAADDTFYAGNAQNTFTGNGGHDVFVFGDYAHSRYGNVWDVITDWSSDYKIDVSGIDAIPGGADDAYTSLVTGPANRNVGLGELKIFHLSGDTFVIGDTTGDGLADFKIQLIGNITDLTLDNFIL